MKKVRFNKSLKLAISITEIIEVTDGMERVLSEEQLKFVDSSHYEIIDDDPDPEEDAGNGDDPTETEGGGESGSGAGDSGAGGGEGDGKKPWEK